MTRPHAGREDPPTRMRSRSKAPMAATAYSTGGPGIHRPPAGHAHHDPARLPAAVRPRAAAIHYPACATTLTSWNLTRQPRQPPGSAPAKDLAVPSDDCGPSRWRIPAAAGVPSRCQQRRPGPPESDRAPPRMRWRGPARPRRAGWPVARPCPAPRAARRGQAPARGTGLPAPPTFPGSPPGGARFRTVKTFLLPPRAPRKSPRPAISGSYVIHE